MSAGEDGILGNLPRERPGRRSGKRADAKTAQPATGQRAASATKRSTATAAPPRAASAAKLAPEVPADPVREAARIAGQVAGAGVRTASRIAGGVLNRLSRP